MQSYTTTITHSYINTSYSRCSFFIPSLFSFFFPSSYALFQAFISEHDCTPLKCFYKGCIQSNQQLALTQIMHSIHCGDAIFPYKVHERRPAQKTLIGCVGLHNSKLGGTEYRIRACINRTFLTGIYKQKLGCGLYTEFKK
jgi:hypothetical protein